MSVIEIHDLVKKYGETLAVDNLNLNIEKGGVYGFLGPNGAGKSTTMNIITGYIGSTAGTVKICGYDVFKDPLKAKQCVGYLPEMPPLYQDMTVIEYLKFVAELKKIPKKEREKFINQAVDMTGIIQVENRLIKNLSKGYKQRVGIAQAVLGMPEIIILDEPTVGIDPKQIIEIRKLIKKLGKKHTVILSSHILSEISEVCDYIFIISRGSLVAEGTEEELTKKMAGENVLDVEIKATKDETDKILKNVLSNIQYEISEFDNRTKVQITTDREDDIREKMFYECAKNKKPILQMSFKQNTLEDIFIELTKDYKAPDKKKHRFGRKNASSDIDEKDIQDEIEALNKISNQEEE